MDQVYRRNFDEPDEIVEVDKVRSEIIRLGGVSVLTGLRLPEILGGQGRFT